MFPCMDLCTSNQCKHKKVYTAFPQGLERVFQRIWPFLQIKANLYIINIQFNSILGNVTDQHVKACESLPMKADQICCVGSWVVHKHGGMRIIVWDFLSPWTETTAFLSISRWENKIMLTFWVKLIWIWNLLTDYIWVTTGRRKRTSTLVQRLVKKGEDLIALPSL